MLNNCGPSGSPPNSATLQGVIQGPDLVALWGDEICPLCGKAHEDEVGEEKGRAQVKESRATKAACGEIQSAVNQMNLTTDEEKKKYGMIGAIECACHQIYVAQSNAPQDDLRPKLSRFHHLAPGKQIGGPRTKKRRKRFTDLVPGIGELFDNMKDEWEEYDAAPKAGVESRNFPGTCAAQQAMLLAMDHGCRAKAMTERLAKGKAESPGFVANIAVRRVRKDGSLADAELESFGGEKPVPPCATCQVMLTAMMCNQFGKRCEPPVTSDSCGKCTPSL